MAGAFVKKYLDLYHRLRALSKIDPEDPDACWMWTGTLRGRSKNYPRVNVWTPDGHKQLAAHRLSLCAQEILDNGGDWDLLWMLYLFYLAAEFEADHDSCNCPKCINSSHLVWRTKEEHRALTISRKRERDQLKKLGLRVSP